MSKQGLRTPSGTPLPLMLKYRPLAPSEAMSQAKGAHVAQPCGLMQPFSIPVQITLQGGQRRQGRTAISTSGRKRNTHHNGGDPPDGHKKLPSSAGEDRATLLGFTMMGFSVLMFFLFGITILKPLMLSTQREEANCTMILTRITDEGMDCAFTCDVACQGQGKYPCLQVLVNLAHSGQKALLHYNEEAVQRNSKCFYTPKCHRDRNDLLIRALHLKEFFDHINGTPFSCFYSPESQSEDVILIKKYDQMAIFHCFLWPSLTLLGGALIVGMVRLTQYLSLLCEKYRTAFRDEAGGKVPYREQHRRSRAISGRWPN